MRIAEAEEEIYEDEIVYHWKTHFVRHNNDLGQSDLLRCVAWRAFCAGYRAARDYVDPSQPPSVKSS